MKPMVLVTLATSALTALVVGNAYSQKRQFYTTLVYLLNSNRTLGVLYVQAAVMLWVTTTVFKNLFFGTLRAAEVEHLVEKSWYMVLETFILLAGFHEDMQVGFVATITFLFVVKAFHWLIEERINYMERSPLISWTFHLRAVSILFLLAAIDLLYIRYSWSTLRTRGASVQIVFGLEVYTYNTYNLKCIGMMLDNLCHPLSKYIILPYSVIHTYYIQSTYCIYAASNVL
jgi:E3 ubiquitin-protein ligase synoviolin